MLSQWPGMTVSVPGSLGYGAAMSISDNDLETSWSGTEDPAATDSDGEDGGDSDGQDSGDTDGQDTGDADGQDA
jgi:hypothetical protein